MVTYSVLQPSESLLYRSIRLESLKTYPNSYGSNYEDQQQRKELGFEGIIKQQLPDQFIMGAFQANQLLGICGFYRNQDEREQHKGAIIQMYVRPSFQGQKIGYALLKATLERGFHLPEVERINLGVYAHNIAAIQIYKKVGFEVYGIEKNCLKIKEGYIDLLLMSLLRMENGEWRMENGEFP